ncbi:hypothetical protein ABI_39470 [Asticcacaulis biprosthecium C19]|uniref:DUF2336 domain-containing protein n=1 Tax=Asticcacaulis biprosthecium C19 TaxID=715226 RepID=F4QS11_9CAUL|nr:DUF2336 domain-containing protein [Asticcacaulis biprosthecium]EGF89531.1 hypothetical protein ABI_39470 [Asticcacaulis biprosthecium C19]
MPALKSVQPIAEPVEPVAAPRPDFHTVRFHTPHCETRAVAHAPEALRNDHDLIVRLCRMPIDLAAPLLRSSLPSLDTPALLALIAATGEAHHLLIAQRPALDWKVVRALQRSGHDSVLVALVRNPAAELDEDDQTRLERLAQERPELRQALSERFRRAVPAADPATWDSHSNLKLLKFMRSGETDGFVREASRRLKLDIDSLNRVLAAGSAVPLALTCCALELDRAVFLHLLSFWQNRHNGEPQLNDRHRPVVLSVFTLPPAEARQKLAARLA